MPLTAEQMKASLGARRLQDDEVLQSALDRIVADNTLAAIYLGDAHAREQSRQMVLAVNRLRDTLDGDATLPDEVRAQEALAKSME